MIDGVKLLCNLNPEEWTNNKNLSFRSWIDEATGEVPNNNKHAKINGLHLSIIQSEKDTFCNVRGSLPKYYTNGETNANDYDFSDFLTTCEQLRNDLQIKPENALLRGFEFGVNINLPFDIATIYESIKSYKMHICGINEMDGKRNGVRFDFQQFRVKIYDKGLQNTGKKSRLMRFEVSIKKMIWVKKLGIKTLADLQSRKVWAELSRILLNIWADIIFVDKSLSYKAMTNHQQKKYLRFLDIHYWASLNRNIYYKSKNDLNKFQIIYDGKENTKELISTLILEKCKLLTTQTDPEIGDNLTAFLEQKNTFENPQNLQQLKNQNWRQINHLDKGLKALPNPPTFLIENDPEHTPQNLINESTEKTAKKSNCMNCKKTLKEKQVTAKFCTDKCRKAFHEREQTKANQKKRIGERERLEKVLNDLPKTNLSLLVMYKADGLQYADQLRQREISASSEWIKQIEKVLITGNKSEPPIEFTTLRAKKLIREIAKLNR